MRRQLLTGDALAAVIRNRFGRGDTRPILFADFDGAVLNDHTRYANGYCGSVLRVVNEFNRIIAETDCVIVVQSAWRYCVLRGEWTVVGLEECLLTHGVDCEDRIAAVTRPDKDTEESDRGQQVTDWLAENAHAGRYCVVDDLDLGITAAGHPFIQTDGAVGLTAVDAERAIAILRG